MNTTLEQINKSLQMAQNELNPYGHAGLIKRILIYITDHLIWGGTLAVLFYLYYTFFYGSIGIEKGVDFNIMLISIPTVSFFYYMLQLSSKHQATFGMRLFDMKLTNWRYKKPSFIQLFFRFSFGILFGLVNVVLIGLSKKKRALNDWIARTYVVHRDVVSVHQ